MALEQLASVAVPEIPEIAEPITEPVGLCTAELAENAFPYTLASNAFGHYCVPVSLAQTAQAQALARAEVPEEKTLQLIARKLGQGDLVTGCTGLGGFLPAFHDALAPNAMIHAYEPDTVGFAASSVTAQLNGLDRVNLHQAVAGKRLRDFPTARLTDDAEGVEDANTPDGPVEFVQMKKLDTLVPLGRYVSVIHLNSYGLEMPAILGGKRVVQDSAPLIVMKAVKSRTQRFFLSCLQAHFPDLGYQYAGTMDDNGIYLALNRT